MTQPTTHPPTHLAETYREPGRSGFLGPTIGHGHRQSTDQYGCFSKSAWTQQHLGSMVEVYPYLWWITVDGHGGAPSG